MSNPEKCLRYHGFQDTLKDLMGNDRGEDSAAYPVNQGVDIEIDPQNLRCGTMQKYRLTAAAIAADQTDCNISSKDICASKTWSSCQEATIPFTGLPQNESRALFTQCTRLIREVHPLPVEQARDTALDHSSGLPSDHEADKCRRVISRQTASYIPTKIPMLIPSQPRKQPEGHQAHFPPLSMNRTPHPLMFQRSMNPAGPGQGLRLDTLSADQVADGPISPDTICSDPGDTCSGYDTPLTSPCSSPLANWPPSPETPSSSPNPALDGARDHDDDKIMFRELQQDYEFEIDTSIPGAIRLTPPKVRGKRSSEICQKRLPDLKSPPLPDKEVQYHGCNSWNEDETPLAPASKAHCGEAFPFPERVARNSSSAFLSRQRHPSALLQHCERAATPRQRSLMAGGLQAPDRFITGRLNTPTKDALLLRTGTPKGSAPIDPFGPDPGTSPRRTERLATIRSIPPPRAIDPFDDRSSITTDRPNAGPDAVWTVAGTVVTEGVASTTNGRGGRVTSGTSAPHYTVDFLRRNTPSEQETQHGQRLAAAMEISTEARMLTHSSPISPRTSDGLERSPHGDAGKTRTSWNNGAWEKDITASPTKPAKQKAKDVPIIPFRVLDAPALRDDYYCSLLAYSPTLQCLAVGLGPHVYLWSEHRDTAPIPDPLTAPFDAHVTSLSFSSIEGGSAILAVGRADGRMNLWSPKDPGDPRFDIKQPSPISCVSFRPTTQKRKSIRESSETVLTEELLIGDEAGNVYMYSIEWPSQDRRDLFDWHGSMTMLAKFSCHTQQVCGIAWSRDGFTFATGGNDNTLFVYDSKSLFHKSQNSPTSDVTVRNGNSISSNANIPGQGDILSITPGRESKIFHINAACKAIAFAPWQSSLIAARGGSNDRCIHFYHAQSGASLATIDCLAQVTSLTWSETRSEIAATFGFAQPDHPVRVAVFSWPSCREIVRIPWVGEERALYAIAYPGGPTSGGVTGDRKRKGRTETGYGKRTREEGCLVIATSDASIKFHEVWPEGGDVKSKRINGGGLLGGSQILEDGISEELERKSAIR